MHDFFKGSSLPKFFSASFLVLIPKVDNPKGFDKFRLLSLCSVFYKLCTKILVGRLSPLLSRMISPEQGAFIPGRSIFESISLTQEMIHSINKPVRGGNVVLKIDMAKTYDSVHWSFLLHVLAAFGFSEQVCAIFKQSISSPWFSMVMNGSPKGFFQGGWGLHQGDPISPYLFIVVEEVLSRLLKKQFQDGKITPFYHPRDTLLISHLLYADDIVLFVNGIKASLRAISKTLALYEKWSGQKVNKKKSYYFFQAYHCC